MVFATLESERGLINVVVKPAIYERYRQVWRGCLPVRLPVPWQTGGTQTGRLVVVTGVVERRQGVVNVIARHVADISPADSG